VSGRPARTALNLSPPLMARRGGNPGATRVAADVPTWNYRGLAALQRPEDGVLIAAQGASRTRIAAPLTPEARSVGAQRPGLLADLTHCSNRPTFAA
jgi:hypothetical protein